MLNKIYEGAEKDIVLSIPMNAVEITVNITAYEDGELVEMKQTLNMEAIKECENLFEKTVDGEYPKFVFTEKGLNELEKYFD